LLAFGAIVAGQLRRLFVRRDTLAKAGPGEGATNPSTEDQADPDVDPNRTEEKA
jgi:hypothetical protein